MSFTRSTFVLRAARAPVATRIVPSRSFQTFRALNAGKESGLHNENRAEEIEKAKQEQLRKQKEGKGEWHEDLSSDSESIVKADRGEHGEHPGSTEEHIKQLQKEGEKLAGKK